MRAAGTAIYVCVCLVSGGPETLPKIRELGKHMMHASSKLVAFYSDP
jgi:hypothetical protein